MLEASPAASIQRSVEMLLVPRLKEKAHLVIGTGMVASPVTVRLALQKLVPQQVITNCTCSGNSRHCVIDGPGLRIDPIREGDSATIIVHIYR